MEEENRFNLKKFLFGNIRKKFLFIFVSIFVSVFLIMILSLYFQERILKENFTNSIIETERDFLNIKKESIRTLSATLEVVLQDPGLKQIYLEKDREKLFNYAQPLFQELKMNYQITHFYFILPDGHNFVRIHNKEKYGDEIKRVTFLKAQETQKISSGIELGKTAYALRVVKPYYNNGELIGYVELGQEIDQFLEIMKQDQSKELSLIVEKKSLEEDDWRSFRVIKNLRDNWDDLEEHVTISSTIIKPISCVSDDSFNLLIEQTSALGKYNIDDKVFVCGGFSIIDAHNKTSGVIFSFIDLTKEQKIVDQMNYIFLGFFSLMIFFFVWNSLYISKNISDPIRELTLAAKQTEIGNFKSKVDIKTGDELEILGDTFNKTIKVLYQRENEHKQLEKAKKEFLSITSHELRSPMTPMQSQLQMLTEEYYGKLNKEQKKALDIIIRNTKRLDNIIVDFLEISRIEAARLRFRFLKKDLTPYINRLIEEMSVFMSEKSIKIVTKIEKLPIISVDPDRTMQILRNLINNAIKFSRPNTTITVSIKLSEGMILFSVKDQGIGIKMEDQKRIFEPFFQAEQTMYREHGGTGLGLAIVKGIVESQNGRVWVNSKFGEGTTFFFTIPLKPVLNIKPIKVLFSEQEDIFRKIKKIFINILGPIGEKEFELLRNKNKLSKKDILEYITLLRNKGGETILESSYINEGAKERYSESAG